MRPTSAIARHVLLYATGSAVGGVTRAVLLPIIARTLTTAEYGVFSLLLAAVNLIHLVFELGLVTALIKFHSETEDVSERIRLRSIVFLVMPAVDVLLALPLLLVRDLASRVLFGTPEYGDLFAIAVAIAFFAAQFQLFLGHLRAHDRSRMYAALMAVKGAISLSLTLFLVVGLDWGVRGFLLGNLAGPALVALVGIPLLMSRTDIDFSGARARLRSMLAFGVPLVPSAIGIWLLSHLDSYLLRVLADLRSVGLYGFASELCLPIVLLYFSVNLAWPSYSFSRAKQEGGPEELARVFRHVFVALVAAALAVTVLRREILAVVATDEYAGAARVLPFLALATVLYAASTVFSTGVQVAGNTRRLPLFVLAATLTNAGLNLLLIPSYREVGAAAATVITNLVLCLVMWKESNRQFPIPYEIGRLTRILLAAVVVSLAADASGELAPVTGLAIRVAALAAYPLLLVLTGAVSVAELRALPSVLAEISSRRSS